MRKNFHMLLQILKPLSQFWGVLVRIFESFERIFDMLKADGNIASLYHCQEEKNN